MDEHGNSLSDLEKDHGALCEVYQGKAGATSNVLSVLEQDESQGMQLGQGSVHSQGDMSDVDSQSIPVK